MKLSKEAKYIMDNHLKADIKRWRTKHAIIRELKEIESYENRGKKLRNMATFKKGDRFRIVNADIFGSHVNAQIGGTGIVVDVYEDSELEVTINGQTQWVFLDNYHVIEKIVDSEFKYLPGTRKATISNILSAKPCMAYAIAFLDHLAAPGEAGGTYDWDDKIDVPTLADYGEKVNQIDWLIQNKFLRRRK